MGRVFHCYVGEDDVGAVGGPGGWGFDVAGVFLREVEEFDDALDGDEVELDLAVLAAEGVGCVDEFGRGDEDEGG